MSNLRTRHLVPSAFRGVAGVLGVTTYCALVLELPDNAGVIGFTVSDKFTVVDAHCVSQDAGAGASTIQVRAGVGANIHRNFMIKRAHRLAKKGRRVPRHVGIWNAGGYRATTGWSPRRSHHSYGWRSR